MFAMSGIIVVFPSTKRDGVVARWGMMYGEGRVAKVGSIPKWPSVNHVEMLSWKACPQRSDSQVCSLCYFEKAEEEKGNSGS